MVPASAVVGERDQQDPVHLDRPSLYTTAPEVPVRDTRVLRRREHVVGERHVLLGAAGPAPDDLVAHLLERDELVDTLASFVGHLGVPVLGGLDIGHDLVGADGGPDQFAVALGAPATLDTVAGTLTVGPCVR